MKKNWLIISFNKKSFLKVGNKFFSCQIGAEGLKNGQKKVEGDKLTPIGKWYLQSIYYRSDRVLRPKPKKKNVLKINRITKYCGWCDDVKSHFYNKYIKINKSRLLNTNYEKLWREDNVYDIVIQISHNTKPTIKNKGSAIFIHCSFEDLRSTAGCVAIKKEDLMYLIRKIENKTYIQIKSNI
jgi:L,D-peptidoglycan transpeptidase YkuD (ErfK/YbiS/YcfS/YnhG family)